MSLLIEFKSPPEYIFISFGVPGFIIQWPQAKHQLFSTNSNISPATKENKKCHLVHL